MAKQKSLTDYILTGLFLIFGLVQYNDPDGWVWMIIYFIVAISIFMREMVPNIGKNIILIGFTLGVFSYLPSLMDWVSQGMPSVTGSMKAENPFVELVREAGGLVVSLIALVYFRFKK